MAPSVWGRLGVVVVGALIAQVGVLNGVVVLGAHPDVMVLLPVAAGIIAGPQRGAIVGFVVALLGGATSALYAAVAAVLHQPGMLTTGTADVLVVVALGGLVLGYPVLRV